MIGKGNTNTCLSKDEAYQIVAQTLDSISITNKKVLVLIPDSTRSCPLPMMFDAVCSYAHSKASKLDFLIALGTHPPMEQKAIDKLVGISKAELNSKYPGVNVYNHLWDDPNSLKSIGNISEDKINDITSGLFKMNVDVKINKMIFDYDEAVIIGPVFPHEVVGFSGGYKYFFPGICGSEFLNFFHWFAAIITNPKIIGTKDTPVRDLINIASKFIPIPVHTLNMVVHGNDMYGLYGGDPKESWRYAADLAGKIDIKLIDKPFKKILSCAPLMYDDLWTGGKCMYKLENAVEDGGELIIYAPHIDEISYTHGKIIDEIGYHVRDYFVKQWDKFKQYPWGIVAHSTHVRGIGTYENGVEKGRIKVTLATSIPKERCEKVNLGYYPHESINMDEWKNREDEGILVVPNAGEVLYRLKNPPEWSGK